MHFNSLFIVLFFTGTLFTQGYAQNETVDEKYREDQFYAGFTYNFFNEKPNNLQQRSFSLGVHAGFIRDMPINKNRDLAIGLGLGISFNGLNTNVLIEKASSGLNGDYMFSLIQEQSSFRVNRFSMHMLEIPLEFRWRTSTTTSYKFWRIYSGVKVGYIFHSSSKYENSSKSIKLFNINAIEALQYGLQFSAGYNTWNFYFYYGLSNIFNPNSKFEDGTSFSLTPFKAGLMFYIL